MKSFNRHKKTSIYMDIAPLIDVMFMLLLFFILTSSFMTPSIPLKLPKASNEDRIEMQDIIVSVDKEDNIYLNRQKVDLGTLESLLKQRIALSEGKRIIFQGDENILFKRFIKIMDIIKQSGAMEINISHELTDDK